LLVLATGLPWQAEVDIYHGHGRAYQHLIWVRRNVGLSIVCGNVYYGDRGYLRQVTIEGVDDLNWKAFELLVIQLLKKHGYSIVQHSSNLAILGRILLHN